MVFFAELLKAQVQRIPVPFLFYLLKLSANRWRGILLQSSKIKFSSREAYDSGCKTGSGIGPIRS
jgi:hypothetical protein